MRVGGLVGEDCGDVFAGIAAIVVLDGGATSEGCLCVLDLLEN